MFGPVDPSDIPPEICTGNCPRVFPIVPQKAEEEKKEKEEIPEEYTTAIGKRIYPERFKPCYLFIILQRKFCRSLRNYIVSNSSKMEVIEGKYCGIATKVFNANTNTLENQLSTGLIKFKTTDQAYRYLIHENKMTRQEFLGGKFDIWNLTMCAEDRSIVPNPTNPDKSINKMNVFHFVHVKKYAQLPDNLDELPPDAQKAAEEAMLREKAEVEDSLKSVEKYEGRLVVQTDAMVRIRGLPLTNKAEEPQKFVYMTQWKGVYYFWQWFESEDGKRFLSAMKDYTGGDYQSYVFTCCLDFHDLS